MVRRRSALLLVSSLLCVPLAARAASGGTPLTVDHSGYLLDGQDGALDSPGLGMTFRIYTLAMGGTLEWEATCSAVPVRRGYYSVTLGSSAAGCAGTSADPVLETSDLPPESDRFLEVVVGVVALTPRARLAALPAAAVALDARRLGGALPASFHDAALLTGIAPPSVLGTGSSAITTLGVVTTGTWHGDPLADAYVAGAAIWNAKIAAVAHDATLTGAGTAASPLSVDVAALGLGTSAFADVADFAPVSDLNALDARVTALEGGGSGSTPPPSALRSPLIFKKGDFDHLRRVPAATGNAKTWTFSTWVKQGESAERILFSAHLADATALQNLTEIFFATNNAIGFYHSVGGSIVGHKVSSQAFYTAENTAKWLHVVVAVDTTNADPDLRYRLWVNNSEVTSFATDVDLPLNANTWVNQQNTHYVGRWEGGSYFDGLLGQAILVDGLALTPGAFGGYAASGVWMIKDYAGAWGTNGFYLDFSSPGALGKDKSGHDNDWSPLGGLNGTRRRFDAPDDNFCVLNPFDKHAAQPLTLANTRAAQASVHNAGARATCGLTSGKWYWETTFTNVTALPSANVGVGTAANSLAAFPGENATSWGVYNRDGRTYHAGNNFAYGPAFSTGDVIMTALDMNTGKIWWGRNGVWSNAGNPATGVNPAFSNLGGNVIHPMAGNDDCLMDVNFGQGDPGGTNAFADQGGVGRFRFAPPAGFLAISSRNLP